VSAFNIPIMPEDKVVVAKAVLELGQLKHLKYMTYDMLAQITHFKPSKIRNILQDMLDSGEVSLYEIPCTGKRKRYIYFLTEAGKLLTVAAPEEV
jgi:predicted transcriptional regulator